MLGAIIGDIAGSRFEFRNHRSKVFELFHDSSFFTDDSVMTLAVAHAVMDWDKGGRESMDALSRLAVRHMRGTGRHYPLCGYGGHFHEWMRNERMGAYYSWGNGAAMRISAAGWAAGDEEDLKQIARALTAVTHSHPEGLKGAEATALCIFMARKGASRDDIKDRIQEEYYDLSFTIDSLRPAYRFDESCQGTVPQAIAAFLESSDFEDAIRTAVSLGGDSDTLAAITGSIAEAFYGKPLQMEKTALSYLDERLRGIYFAWKEWLSG